MCCTKLTGRNISDFVPTGLEGPGRDVILQSTETLTSLTVIAVAAASAPSPANTSTASSVLFVCFMNSDAEG